jgi:hypothetical protein
MYCPVTSLSSFPPRLKLSNSPLPSQRYVQRTKGEFGDRARFPDDQQGHCWSDSGR